MSDTPFIDGQEAYRRDTGAEYRNPHSSALATSCEQREADWIAASDTIDALTDRLHTVERERDQWVEDFGMFTVDTCPIGEHATYAFDAEGNTACPGCTIDTLSSELAAARAVVEAAREALRWVERAPIHNDHPSDTADRVFVFDELAESLTTYAATEENR